MIVEFIGCSGAGKTTLAHLIRDGSPPRRPARMALDLLLDRPGWRSLRQPQVVNLAVDAAVLPSFVSWPGRRELLRFADRRLRRHAPSWLDRVNYLVNVERRVGLHLLARRTGRDVTMLLDEGSLLLSYQLFVYAEGAYDRADLERLTTLVPLPDRVVFVRAPLDVLVERSLRRPDPRRELAVSDRDALTRCMIRASTMFEQLAAVPSIAGRLLVADVSADGAETLRETAARIAAELAGDPVAAGDR